ncbi:MAG TPA: alkaline phosphatase family protein, partial [Gemmataceae bacterium]|nr:alkaline phosphatase family protein [Gemmataceae bacterium]
MNRLHPRAAAVLRFAWLLPLLGLVCIGFAGAGPRPAPAGRPKLAVLVVFDQMRGDYPIRWRQLFGEGGFRRLAHDGAWFQDCHYPYATTVTAAGHASIHTGCSPRTHGIIANEWFDRASGGEVYCVASPRYTRVPPVAGGDRKRNAGAAPERLLAPTLADALETATDGQAKVVSLSFKDRSAVLPGGRRPDACYWLDTATGQFVTSTYYRDMPQPWVTAFNDAHPADRWYGGTWDRLRPDLDYAALAGPDDQPGEGGGALQGRTFPHPMSGGPLKLKATYYGALYDSPFGNDLLLELAERAIDAEQLGKHDVPDLLCVSFSCNDPVGHTWGPDSQEVLDVTLRSDRLLRELLDHLDRAVGAGRYLLAVTADHGVCPLPEVARRRGEDTGRISPAKLRQGAEEFLDESFGPNPGKAPWLEAAGSSFSPAAYLNQAALAKRGLKSADVEAALAGWLVKQPGIQAAYTRTQLLAGVPADD